MDLDTVYCFFYKNMKGNMWMDIDKIYEVIQKALSTVPLILVGTGGTIPYGIPGMRELAQRLVNDLDKKYCADKQWSKFSENLKKSIDLERALTDVRLTKEMIYDVVNVTWNLVNEADIKLMENWITGGIRPELGKMINRFYQAEPQCVNVITTNYDRVIEYSCDQLGIPVDCLFEGEFFKKFRTNNQVSRKKIVNLLKVHGSLDWYCMQRNEVVSIPLQRKIPAAFTPAIITPGTSKYQRVLESPFRDILHIADVLIEKAQNYLCIGYGFNDSQIQHKIIRGIQMGKPIVVLTKELSGDATKLVKSNSDKFIIIQAYKDDDSKTEIILPMGTEIVDEQLWTQKGLLKVI